MRQLRWSGQYRQESLGSPFRDRWKDLTMDARKIDRLNSLRSERLSRRSASRRALAGMAGAALGVGATRALAQDATPYPDGQGAGLKVVLHVSDPDGWPPALSNLKNLTTEFSAMEVLVVVDGGGVYVFQGSNDLTAELETVAQKGVRIQACHNALDEKQIDPSTLPAFVEVVPGGVPALVEAQNAGYRYVKP
jgi:intracellular sulfur oxidation DsrE/DsrF family protein